MSLRYDFNGTRHMITVDEVQDIERSGASHRVQDYANLRDGHLYDCGYFDPATSVLSLGLKLMQDRCGPVEAKNQPLRMHITSRDEKFLKTFIAYASTAELSEATGIDPSIIIRIRKTTKVHAQVLHISANAIRIMYEVHMRQRQ